MELKVAMSYPHPQSVTLQINYGSAGWCEWGGLGEFKQMMQDDNYSIYYVYTNFPYLMKYDTYRVNIFIQTIARNIIQYKMKAPPTHSIMLLETAVGSGNGPSKTSLSEYYHVL